MQGEIVYRFTFPNGYYYFGYTRDTEKLLNEPKKEKLLLVKKGFELMGDPKRMFLRKH